MGRFQAVESSLIAEGELASISVIIEPYLEPQWVRIVFRIKTAIDPFKVFDYSHFHAVYLRILRVGEDVSYNEIEKLIRVRREEKEGKWVSVGGEVAFTLLTKGAYYTAKIS